MGDSELRAMCEAEIALHEPCGGCDNYTIARALLERLSQPTGWMPITEAGTSQKQVIGMDAKGNVYRTWFFAPSSRTRNWLRSPGNVRWKPVVYMVLPTPPVSAPVEAIGGRE